MESRESVGQFIEDSSIHSAQDLFSLNTEGRQDVMKTITTTILRFYTKLVYLQAERSSEHAPADSVLLCVVPFEIFRCSLRKNFDVIELQRDVLMASHFSAYLVHPEEEFKDL